MQIEVGKTYVDGVGDKVKIVEKVHSSYEGCDYVGENGDTYTQDGSYDPRQGRCISDLIAEWSEPAEADGWITWAGGECPVPGDTVVEVRLADETESTFVANGFNWGDTGILARNIVTYRIAAVDKKPLPATPPAAPNAAPWPPEVPPTMFASYADAVAAGWCVHPHNSGWMFKGEKLVEKVKVFPPLAVAHDMPVTMEADSREYTGGSVGYYSVVVARPTSGGAPYTAECNDLIEALNLNYAEGNVLKAVWRIAAARQGRSKRGYDDERYDSEKIVFFGQRMVAQNGPQ